MSEIALVFFVVLSMVCPVDIFNSGRYCDYSRDIDSEEIVSHERTRFTHYGFAEEMLYCFGGGWRKLQIEPLHIIRYWVCYPFLRLAIHPNRMLHSVVNLLLLVPCLILIKYLNCIHRNALWNVIPFMMWLISFRSFLPGVLLAIFLLRPKILTAIILMFYSSFSSAVVVLCSFIVCFVTFTVITGIRRKLVIVAFVFVPITILVVHKGFCFGQIRGKERFNIRSVPYSFIKSFQDNSFF